MEHLEKSVCFFEPHSTKCYYQRWHNFTARPVFVSWKNIPETRKFHGSETIEQGVEESKDSDPVCIYIDNKDLKRKVCDSDCS